MFKAQSQLEFTIHQDIDAEQLDYHLVPVPRDDLWPPFTNHLTLAPCPLPNDTFRKKPLLIGLSSETGRKPRETLLHEAYMSEILRLHLHINIASYLGCVRNEGLVNGLCFVRYKKTLSDRLRDSNQPLDLRSCLKSVKKGPDHLHSLGLNHNDMTLQISCWIRKTCRSLSTSILVRGRVNYRSASGHRGGRMVRSLECRSERMTSSD